jgi:hypothetical protein
MTKWLWQGVGVVEEQARQETSRGNFDAAHTIADTLEPESERQRVHAWIEATRERMGPPQKMLADVKPRKARVRRKS